MFKAALQAYITIPSMLPPRDRPGSLFRDLVPNLDVEVLPHIRTSGVGREGDGRNRVCVRVDEACLARVPGGEEFGGRGWKEG